VDEDKDSNKGRVQINMVRIFVILGFVVFNWVCASAQTAEVLTEAKVFEVDRGRLRELGIPARVVSSERLESDFITNVSESTARALASSPGAKLLQSFQLTTVGENAAEFRIASRVAATQASAESQRLDVGFDFRLLTRVSLKREIAMTLISQAKIRSIGNEAEEAVSPISGQAIRHEITTAEGASVAAGGFITDADTSQLSKIETLRGSPVLNYLFSRGNAEPELLVVLTPRIVRITDAAVATAPSTARATQPSAPTIIDLTPKKPEGGATGFTVQVAAFTTEAKARGYATELIKTYPNVFVDTLKTSEEGRFRYRVRIGRFSSTRAAKELEQQLRRDGLDTFVANLN
jgi:hypothetical protein